MSQERPDPQALLRRISAAEASRRGRLKIFFGASPGVGKTYAMLEQARLRHRAGADVLLGWVETHGRAETAALVEGLERLPPREVEYRGVKLLEFDLDAALARKSELALLDELAHTNAAGSRHAKRWQDAEELLEAGIDVYTTLNVQHVESLNDLVNQITGAVTRETVPDRLLDDADLEFVDLPLDELLARLRDGKVYVPGRAAAAMQSFFRPGNLLALRELALRRTAEHVDADVRGYRHDHAIEPTWPVAERILVCVRPNPESERLVRAARRIAARLKAEWIVAYVESPTQPELRAEERRTLAKVLKLAEELGAETTALSGESVSEALLDFARRRNASRIVVGKPSHARWRDRLKGSLLDEIVRGSGDVEVLVIPGGQKGSPGAPPERARGTSRRLGPYAWSVATVLGCTLVCWAMFGRFDKSNLVMVYLAGVAFVATFHGRAAAALAAVLGVGAFDFFFVPPYMTFAVGDTQYLVTFGVMLLVSLLISTLASRVRAQAEAAQSRERRTQALYAMSRELAAAKSAPDVAAAASRHVSDILRGPVELLLPAGAGRLEPSSGPAADAREAAVAQWAFDHGRAAGLGTDTLPGASVVYVPVRGGPASLGVLAVRPHESLLPLAPDQMDLLDTLASQAASALQRIQLASEAEQARLAAEAERLRSTLLSSVSHDLRTPLAAITGAASSLLQPAPLDPAAERGLKQAIYDEAERLGRLVANLLDMTRFESGSLQLDREWHSLEELVGAALARVEGAMQGRSVHVRLPKDLPLLFVDPVLLEQLLVNLLENAAKYAPGSRVALSAEVGEREVTLEVADEGPGLAPGEEERVFEKFHRGASGPRGFGLGLAICRAIASAHGGRIWAQNRAPHGAAFRFALPRGEAPPVEEERERA